MDVPETVEKTLVVVGGGAAGVFCAITAARLSPNLRVIVVEKTGRLLQKVKASGGGRCNVTHACFEVDEMANRYPRGKNFVKKAFHQFFTTDTIQWFEQRGVLLKTEVDGRMFPKANTSQAIIDCLQAEMQRYNVEVRLHCQVMQIQPVANQYQILLADKTSLPCQYVMLACGGQSKPEHFNWLQNFSFPIAVPVPSLFTFNFPGHPLNQLTGLSAPNASVKIGGFKMATEGPVLITHWGISGPAVLRLSAFAAAHLAEVGYQYEVIINWCKEYTEPSLLQSIQQLRTKSPGQKVINGNFTLLPARLWLYLLSVAGIQELHRWADLTNAQMNKLASAICNYRVTASGKTTYKDEFVTAGGIETSEVDANTMMCKRFPSLYLGGEIMNVDGITGGYNFQHAWTSGYIAGQHIAMQANG
jgi:predicted Rossmann fold flavoprotein